MFLSSVRAVITVLFLASAVSAEIVDPVFVRGNKRADGWFDHLTAFESASDMVGYQNPIWTQPMSNPNYGSSWFFNGQDYIWIDSVDTHNFWQHNYGSYLDTMINDSGSYDSFFTRSDNQTGGTWFADSDGHFYNVFMQDYLIGVTDTIRWYNVHWDVLSDSGHNHTSVPYSFHDRFFAANGKYYRTNTDGNDLVGIDVYASFDDLLAGRQSERYAGGVGSANDLFMVVPQLALELTGPPSMVPEIDPAGIGSVLALIGGCLGLLEQRRKSARRSHAKTLPTDRLVCRLPA